jgi:uncharacterized membrane protein
MAIGLQQMHPALVHAPIALLPVAVGADVIGSISRNESLLSLGKDAMLLSAAGAVGSAVTGLIAGEEVNVEGASMDMLITHRNLNFVATVVAGGMAVWRTSHEKPTVAYLTAGVLGVGVLAYSSYLGGRLVFDAGVGVEPANGVYRADAPALKAGQIVEFFNAAAADCVHGAQHMIQEVGKGKIVPTVLTALRRRPAFPQQRGSVDGV